MRPLRIAVLAVAMMGTGAGLLAAAQHARAGTRPARETAEDDAPPAAHESPRPVLVVGDPRAAAGAEQKLASLTDRMASIEGKLDKLGTQAEAGDEVLTTPPAIRRPEEQQNMDTASSIVDAAVRAGQWVEADQDRMREATAQLLPADRFALHMKLMNAGNAGKLRDLAPRPFFF